MIEVTRTQETLEQIAKALESADVEISIHVKLNNTHYEDFSLNDLTDDENRKLSVAIEDVIDEARDDLYSKIRDALDYDDLVEEDAVIDEEYTDEELEELERQAQAGEQEQRLARREALLKQLADLDSEIAKA
jgi:hypothetical protein